MSAPTRPVLRYHGGKWRLAPWILSFFPTHRVYVEPFGGAASVLMRKPRTPSEVYNDLDHELVNVFRVLRDPETMERLRAAVLLTPYARAEFELAYEKPWPADPVERVRRLLVLAWMGHGGTGTRRHRTGMRPSLGRRGNMPTHDWAGWPAQIGAFCERLQGVLIEEVEALGLIEKYDGSETLFYVDPPYPQHTRTSLSNGHKQHYRHELEDADHRQLATLLHRVTGMVIVSGYACSLYDEDLYADWERHTHAARSDGGHLRTEVVWLSPACSRARLAVRSQHTFDLDA